MTSQEYRQWLRAGVRLFDLPDSVLRSEDRVSYLSMDDLEAAAELCGLDWRLVAPSYRWLVSR